MLNKTPADTARIGTVVPKPAAASTRPPELISELVRILNRTSFEQIQLSRRPGRISLVARKRRRP